MPTYFDAEQRVFTTSDGRRWRSATASVPVTEARALVELGALVAISKDGNWLVAEDFPSVDKADHEFSVWTCHLDQTNLVMIRSEPELTSLPHSGSRQRRMLPNIRHVSLSVYPSTGTYSWS